VRGLCTTPLVVALLCALCGAVQAQDSDALCSPQQRQRLQRQGQEAELLQRSDAAAAKEWRRSQALRQLVGKGQSYYRGLRRSYLERGVCDPYTLITQEQEVVQVGRVWVRVHRSLLPALREADALYDKNLWRGPRVMGGFHARRIRGPFGEGDMLSHHAFGMALDIDAPRNPFLTPEEIALVEEISQRRVLRGLDTPVEQRWRSFDEAVRGFRQNLRGWSQRTAQERLALRRAVRKKEPGAPEALEALERKRRLALRGKHLRALGRPDGFNLPLALVVALERHGLVWSTDFTHGADLMHFEARHPWTQAPNGEHP
jgi:hypothetical protein